VTGFRKEFRKWQSLAPPNPSATGFRDELINA
jgi:hypothetical protein